MSTGFRPAAWQRRSCGLFLAAAGSAAGALPSVELYGLIDLAAEQVRQVGAQDGRISRMPSNTGSLPSRLGLRGSEDLGGGLRVMFTLEQGIAANTGVLAQGGRGFGRQSWVGVGGEWGTLTFGRQYTMLYWSLLDADVLGPALYGSGSLDPYIPNARADNAFVYRTNVGPVALGASYSLGRDVVNGGSPAATNCPGGSVDAKACREASVLVKLDQPAWGLAFARDDIRGGPGAFGGLVSSAMIDSRLSLNGWARLGPFKLAAGAMRRDNEASAGAPRSVLAYLGAVWDATTALVLDAEWLQLNFRGNADRAALFAGRATYSLSRRTAIYAMAGRIDNGGTLALSVSAGGPGSSPAGGAAQGAFALGVRHSF